MSRPAFVECPGALLCLYLCLGLMSCGTPVPADPDGWQVFGAGVSDGTPVTLPELLSDPEAQAGRAVLVEAQVEEVCAAKGCWMTLASGGDSVRVTFLDYGFFVPKDIAGRTVRLEGVFGVREVPVAEARHYLEDAGRHEEAAAVTAPRRAYEIVASGVLVRATE